MASRYCTYCMNPVELGKPCPVCGLLEGAYAPLPHHLPPGTMLLGRYLVGRALGEGGFGITYIGLDLRLELRVAIKEYFPTDRVTRMSQVSLHVSQLGGEEDEGFQRGKERFLYEARTLARMEKQPEIVTVRDYFEENGTAYIVMEYVEGTTFKSWVKQNGGRIPPEELFSTIEPLFGALDAVHRSGLIHRDISPDNLMLENGMVRLLDFGCARESSGGTKTMTVALKHGFAPVEQYQYKGQGPWTDVYSLAATIYFCLTGVTPPQALDRMCDDELIPPRKLGIPLREQQERALLQGLTIRPRRRFQSVGDFHKALYSSSELPAAEAEVRDEEVEQDKEAEASLPAQPAIEESQPPVKKPVRRLPRWLKPAIAVVVVVGVLLAGLWIRGQGQKVKPDPEPEKNEFEDLVDTEDQIHGEKPQENTDSNPQSQQFAVPEGGWNQIQLNALRTDESAFEKARQVDSIDGLLEALDDPYVPAVIITGEVELTIDVRQSKPVLVEEGATVTLTNTVPHTWKVIESYLINRGSMRANLKTEEGGAIINEGKLELGSGDLTEAGGFLNQGAASGETIQFFMGACGFNLGTMEVQETFYLSNSGTFFSNSGTLTVHNWMGIDENARLENHETMILKEETRLENNSYFFNGNTLELGVNSTIQHNGILRWSGGIITGREDAVISGSGLVVYNDEICSVDEAVQMEPTLYCAKELSWTTFEERVSQEGSLRSNMLQKRSTELTAAVALQGDLEVTADLYIPSDASLEIGGTLTIAPGVVVYNAGSLTAGTIVAAGAEPQMALYNSGTLATDALRCSGQALFFNEGAAEIPSVSLTDGAALANLGSLRCAARLELSGSNVYTGGDALLEKSEITEVDSHLFAAGNVQLAWATIQMQQGSGAVFSSPLELDDVSIEIAEECRMDIWINGSTIGEETVIQNSGMLYFSGWYGWTNFTGSLQNSGTMQIFAHYMQITGKLQNDGTIELLERSVLRRGSQADISGGGKVFQVTYDELGNEIRTEQTIS